MRWAPSQGFGDAAVECRGNGAELCEEVKFLARGDSGDGPHVVELERIADDALSCCLAMADAPGRGLIHGVTTSVWTTSSRIRR